MTNPPFEVFEHTADMGLRAYGADLSELFVNGARGMFDIMCDASSVKREMELPVEERDDEIEYLFAAWLNEMLYLFTARRMVLCDCRAAVGDGVVRGVAIGERLDLKRHRLRTEIKAVTHHELRVTKEGDIWTAQVIFDV